MMKDTQQGQTNYCILCEEAGRKIAELERKLAQYQSIFPDSDGHFELKALIAQAKAEQQELWRDSAYAVLGAVRDNMQEADVVAVQKFLTGIYDGDAAIRKGG